MRRALLAIIASALTGCLGIVGPPETFDDMWQRLDAVAVPADFTLIDKDRWGARGGLAPGEPRVVNYYSAPWEGGGICEQLRQLLDETSWSAVVKSGDGTCGYKTQIGAGGKAWLVNIWSYELHAAARAPDPPLTPLSTSECAEYRNRWERAHGPNDYYGRPAEVCWVTPGDALVTIYAEGRRGW